MRSVSSSDVICNISMRWRNCGVRTSRWERLVVSLRDIPKIECVYFYFIFWIIAACGRTGGLYLISVRCGRFSATNQHKKTQKCKHSHTKLFAEVQAANFGIICQVAWLARTKNLALGHYVRAVGNAKSFAHVVVGD